MDITIAFRAGSALRIWDEGGAVRLSHGRGRAHTLSIAETALLVRSLADVAREAREERAPEVSESSLGARMQGSAGATFTRGVQVDPTTGKLIEAPP